MLLIYSHLSYSCHLASEKMVVDSATQHVHSPPRRSTRRQLSKKPSFRWRQLNDLWRRQYLDLGHCRLGRCTRRLVEATDVERQELQEMNLSFVAMSISAAASTSGTSREEDLTAYVRAAIKCNLDANDVFNGDSAVALAAYHGFVSVLDLLLDIGCPLKKDSGRNAIFAAVRNGQHTALEMMLTRRTGEAMRIVRSEEFGYEDRGLHYSSLLESITKGDVSSVRLLLHFGCAAMSDLDAKWLHDGNSNSRKKLENVLRSLYPCMPNVMQWRGALHWSFPRTDRETLNWFWHALHHPSSPELLPDEIWHRVLSFVGRGWWASRRYQLIGAPGSDILQRNIINGP